jgi:hypothetical protein
MKISIPAGTVVTRKNKTVTIDFLQQSYAQRFMEWLNWLDDPQNAGEEMTLSHPKETRQ